MGVAVSGLVSAGCVATLQHCLSNGQDENGGKHASAVFSFLK